MDDLFPKFKTLPSFEGPGQRRSRTTYSPPPPRNLVLVGGPNPTKTSVWSSAFQVRAFNPPRCKVAGYIRIKRLKVTFQRRMDAPAISQFFHTLDKNGNLPCTPPCCSISAFPLSSCVRCRSIPFAGTGPRPSRRGLVADIRAVTAVAIGHRRFCTNKKGPPEF